jgi:hypothetical protein
MGLFDIPGAKADEKRPIEKRPIAEGLIAFTIVAQVIHGIRDADEQREVDATGITLHVHAPNKDRACSVILANLRDDFETDYPERIVREVGLLAVFVGEHKNVVPDNEDDNYVSYDEFGKEETDEEDTDDSQPAENE